jgi:hypothetical protein
MRLVQIIVILVILMIAALGFYSFREIKIFNAKIIPGISMIYPLLILILCVLALRGISRDERLVKSYDRMR